MKIVLETLDWLTIARNFHNQDNLSNEDQQPLLLNTLLQAQ